MRINLRAPVNSLGYGCVGLNITHELVNQGHDVALFPIGNVSCPPQYHSTIGQAIQGQAEYDQNAPSVSIWHQHSLAEHVGRGVRVGWPIFELDRFTPREQHHLRQLDRVIGCSKWAQGIISNARVPFSFSAPESVGNFVVPLGVDTSVFKPSNEPPNHRTVFFNCGKWEIRKGHDVLRDMFCAAFTPRDNVELWMMNHNPFMSDEQNQEWADFYKNSPLGDKIKILNRVNTQEELANIMGQTDCGIFPARAEGWNLEVLEMMACGKPSIVTNYAGHTEFCGPTNSYLVDIEDTEPAFDHPWFYGQGEWASIDERQFEQCVTHMRKVHENKKSLWLEQICLATANRFSWTNSVNRLVEALS